MSAPLELFVARLERELAALAPEIRAKEVEEIRGHIESLAAQKQAQGVSSENAMAGALAQFGSPRKIGRALCRVHQAPESWKCLVAALALCAAWWGFSNLWWPLPSSWSDNMGRELSLLALDLSAFGLILGFVAPRRAHWAVWSCCVVALVAFWPISQAMAEAMSRAGQDETALRWKFMAILVPCLPLLFSPAFVGVYGGRRLKKLWQRKRQAS